jgi:type IV pilus assembly protein PilC
MSRISSAALIRLCHRVGTAVRSGVDVRRVWEMEERHAHGALRTALEGVRRNVAAGGGVAEAMHAANGFFPPMFVQMVAVGEETGKLDEVLLRLGEHYEHLARMRRMFWIGIAWPLFELIFAILIIGLVIWITGVIGASRGVQTDVLGWGLSGTSGAIIWFLGCGLVAAFIALAVMAITKGWLGPAPALAAMRLPLLGRALESLALARLTWSLAMTLESGMDARRAAAISIKAAQNPYYESALPRVTAGIRANRQFHESFADAGVFPKDFLQQLEAAEIAGATNESLLRLAQEYESRAKTGLQILTGIATVGVVILIFGLMIFAIFSMAMQYINTIYDTLEMTDPGKF